MTAIRSFRKLVMRKRNLICALVVVGLLPGLSPRAQATADTAEEYEVKAAMYINLLRLVDWPGKQPDASVPYVIGVSGSDDMARALETISQAKNPGSARRVTVRRISGTVGLEECHSVFVGGGDRKRIQATVLALSKTPVLTVGETDSFLSLGGMIDLTLRDDRVQIEVNLGAAQGAGLAISSRLLKIAVVRKGGAL